jgi:hypothetical protein
MRDYQKKNNKKKNCITNTQYLYDVFIKNSIMNVKTKAVFVLANNNEEKSAIDVAISSEILNVSLLFKFILFKRNSKSL